VPNGYDAVIYLRTTGKRPLGIPALEDKLVQLACAKVLKAIYEEDFLDFSHGYRPNRRAKETVADLIFNLQYGC
jgi:RNA-directed DNA polymerase